MIVNICLAADFTFDISPTYFALFPAEIAANIIRKIAEKESAIEILLLETKIAEKKKIRPNVKNCRK
jgi:hypothetical protein